MGSLKDANLFTLKILMKNFDAKLSAITDHNQKWQILGLVKEDNTIFLRYTNEQDYVTFKSIQWFKKVSKTIQDMCFDSSGAWLLVLCYDNTLHIVPALYIFTAEQSDNTSFSTDFITSFIVPFVGPHECPNTRMCPNNSENSNSFSTDSLRLFTSSITSHRCSVSMLSSSDKQQTTPNICTTSKVNELIAAGSLYNTFFCETNPPINQEIVNNKNEYQDENKFNDSSNSNSNYAKMDNDGDACYKANKDRDFTKSDLKCSDEKCNSTSMDTTYSEPCPFPTCVTWWETSEGHNRAIIGYSDSSICFVALTPNCPFIANTSVENGSIIKLIICKDNSLETITLMINTSENEQWKLLLEQKSIAYIFPGVDVELNTKNGYKYKNHQNNHKTQQQNIEADRKSLTSLKSNDTDSDWQLVIPLNNDNIDTSPIGNNNQLSNNENMNSDILPAVIDYDIKNEQSNNSNLFENNINLTTTNAQITTDRFQVNAYDYVGGEVNTQLPRLFPAARARLASLRDLGAKKIGALKLKITESRIKANERDKLRENSPSLSIMEAPGSMPEVLTTPSGPYFIIQQYQNKYFLSALHSYSDTLSVHSMDISLIPLFLYKLPKECSTIMLTTNLMYTIQNVDFEENMNDNEQGSNQEIHYTYNKDGIKKVNAVGIVSCAMTSMRIGDDCDFNSGSQLALFPFPHEKIINIHPMSIGGKNNISRNNKPDDLDSENDKTYQLSNYVYLRKKIDPDNNNQYDGVEILEQDFPEVIFERCIIVTNKNLYCINFKEESYIAFLKLAKNSAWSACEEYCRSFNLSLPPCIEYAGDYILKDKNVTQALLCYNVARIPPIITALKFAMFREYNALMRLCSIALKSTCILRSKHPMNEHIKELLKTVKERLTEWNDDYLKNIQVINDDALANTGIPCSDFNYESDDTSEIQLSNSSQFHLSNLMLLTLCEKTLVDENHMQLWNFISTNNKYHTNLTSIILSQSGLYIAAILLAKVRGACLDVFCGLVASANQVLCSYTEGPKILYNLSDEIFMETITYLQEIALDYFDAIKRNLLLLNITIIERLEKQLNPFNPIHRPTISRMSRFSTSNNGIEPSEQEFTNFCVQFLEIYIIILIRLKSLHCVENILNALNPIQVTCDNEQFAIQLDNYSPISAGFSHCACVVDGSAYIWGAKFFGVNCAYSYSTFQAEARDLPNIPKCVEFISNLGIEVHAVECGRSHTLILTNNGLYTIGANNLGQLGIGKQLSQALQPMLVRLLDGNNITMMTAGQYHNGVVANGKLYTWGWGVFGQLGLGTIEDVYEPKMVDFFVNKRITQISFGHAHSLVLCEEDSHVLYVFGSNHFGQLGVDRQQDSTKDLKNLPKSLIPIKLEFNEQIKLVSTRYFSNLMVTSSNILYTWGSSPQALRLATQARKRAKASQKIEESLKSEMNRCVEKEKQSTPLETFKKPNDLPNLNSPISSELLNQVSDISLLPKTDVPEITITFEKDEIEQQKVLNSGKKNDSIDEENTDHFYPMRINTSEVHGEIVELSCGLYHFALISSHQCLYTWGKNLERQLGREERTEVFLPTRLNIFDNLAMHVACGCDFTIVMTKHYDVKAFGNNSNGQCGKEPVNDKSSYSGKLVRLRFSKRVVRIPDGNQCIEIPVSINLPRPKIKMDIDPVRYLCSVTKFQKSFIHKNTLFKNNVFEEDSNLNEIYVEESNNTVIDSNLNELCNEIIVSDSLNDDSKLKGRNNGPNTNDLINSTTSAHSTSTITTSTIEETELVLNKDTISDYLHYCLFIFHGLYKHKKLAKYSYGTKKIDNEIRLRLLMLDYKYLDAYKLCMINCSNARNVLKFFEYFTKDTNIVPMHTEDFKFFIYETFMHFINNNYNIDDIENYFINDLDYYLLQLAYVIYFTNINDETEHKLLHKFQQAFGNTENIQFENTELIFQSLSNKFLALLCQRLVEYADDFH